MRVRDLSSASVLVIITHVLLVQVDLLSTDEHKAGQGLAVVTGALLVHQHLHEFPAMRGKLGEKELFLDEKARLLNSGDPETA